MASFYIFILFFVIFGIYMRSLFVTCFYLTHDYQKPSAQSCVLFRPHASAGWETSWGSCGRPHFGLINLRRAPPWVPSTSLFRWWHEPIPRQWSHRAVVCVQCGSGQGGSGCSDPWAPADCQCQAPLQDADYWPSVPGCCPLHTAPCPRAPGPRPSLCPTLC